MSYPPPAPPVPQAEPPAARTRPGSVTFAVWLQILLAAFLLASTVVSYLYGADSQAAAEAELQAQGVPLSDLPQGTTFEPGVGSLAFNVVIAAGLIVLALLNAAGKRPARVITWIVQPIVLVCGAFGALSQLFLATVLEYGIENSGVESDIDVAAVVDAVYGAYPAWTDIVSYGVLALSTLGSILVIVLLAVPASNAYFAKAEPQNFIPGAPAA